MMRDEIREILSVAMFLSGYSFRCKATKKRINQTTTALLALFDGLLISPCKLNDCGGEGHCDRFQCDKYDCITKYIAELKKNIGEGV